MRAAWRQHAPDRPTLVYGDTTATELRVIERLGVDEHRPVRRPDRWKRVYMLGGAVRVDGKWLSDHLLECPYCAALVVDKYAQERHMEALHSIDEGDEPA